MRVGALAALAALAFSAGVGASTSVIGQTFPIAEPDTLAEIQTKAGEKDWHAWMQAKVAPSASAFRSAELPRAAQNDSYLFDPTYALPQDITDADGNVLFPAGTRINVYQKIRMPGRIIVIGPTEADYHWLDTVARPTAQDKVLLASGNVLEQRQSTHRLLFLLEPRAVERFGLRAVPSIVQQEGLQLRVTQFVVDAGSGARATGGAP